MANRETLLRLNDKTVMLVGEFSSMTQMTLTLLCEQGSDVALVGKETPEARRYCDHISDQREIYPGYGRAGIVATDLAKAALKPTDAADIVARVLHSFGRLDALVDTLACSRTDPALSMALARESVKFLTSRPRSRMVWLSHHPRLQDTPGAEALEALRKSMAQDFGAKNLTANELVLGVSEEFLLRNLPRSPSIKLGLEELKKQIPQARLLDPAEIAAWIMFVASPMSQAVNGQSLFVDHGLGCGGSGI
jgi:NAD(P)-dependent dehydrogenase (short-subunit alcohol dehydrogenase family)